VKRIARISAIAALYFILTYLLTPISFGPFQVRISEALVVLPFLFPEAIAGVTLGCFVSNIFSPFGLIDMIFGTFLTFFAALLTWLIGKKFRKKFLAPVPPILLNAFGVSLYVIVLAGLSPLELSELKGIDSFLFVFKHFSLMPYLGGVLTIGLGEALATYALGVPLLYTLERRKIK